MTTCFAAAPAVRASSPPGAKAERRVHVVQGEYHVSADPGVVLTTILGSCVAACLRDPLARVGGWNHFLLPGRGEQAGGDTVRYGVHAMELLVNGLLREDARRERLEAKLFGGARTLEGFTDIGTQNTEFAKHFLQRGADRVHGREPGRRPGPARPVLAGLRPCAPDDDRARRDDGVCRRAPRQGPACRCWFR